MPQVPAARPVEGVSPRDDEEVVDGLMAAATDMAALANRVATDRDFVTELVVLQHNDDDAGFRRMLDSAGVTAEVAFSTERPSAGAERRRKMSMTTIDINLPPIIKVHSVITVT